MKKLYLLAMMGIATLVHGKELSTFTEISDALKQGSSIRMVVQPENPSISAFSFFTDACAVIIRPTYFQFANTHLTTNHPGFEKKPVLENVTYRISEEGEVRITTRVITLPDYEIKGEHSMVCILSNSAKIYTGD